MYFPHYQFSRILYLILILDIFTFLPANHIIHLPPQIQRRLTDLASPCVGLCRCVASWLSFLSILGFGFMTHTRNGVGDTRQSSSPSLWRCAYLACSHKTHAKPFYASSFGKVPIFGLNFGPNFEILGFKKPLITKFPANSGQWNYETIKNYQI